MATINTNDSRNRNAQNLIESFNESDGDASSYLFIGRPNPWENDEKPLPPVNNIREFYDVYNEMLSLKRINDLDVHMLIPRVSWTSGAVYDMYRHDYSIDNKAHSSASNLYDAVYYVLSSNNYVYVCLNNNKNSVSLVEPQNISDAPFVTSDEYQWLKLFKISNYHQDNFATNNMVPVTSMDVVDGKVGALYTVIVNDGGDRYTRNPDGPLADVPWYYCKIIGDGEGAVARVRVRGNSIDAVEVVRPGSGYSFAELDFKPNRVYKGLKQLDDKRNALNPQGDGRFNSTVIIGPPGGWGYTEIDELTTEENNYKSIEQVSRQLSARTVGVFSNLKSTLNDFFPDVQFRQIGILKEVVVSDEAYQNADTLSAVYSIKVSNVSGPEDYIIGETINQSVLYDGEPVIAIGQVVGWDQENSIVRYIQSRFVTNEVYRFAGSEQIIGTESNKITLPATTFSNSEAGLTFRRGYAKPEIQKYEGYLTYLTNISPVTRQTTQSERVSLTITF